MKNNSGKEILKSLWCSLFSLSFSIRMTLGESLYVFVALSKFEVLIKL